MAKTDANPPMPDFVTDYELQEVDPSFLTSAVKPKQFLHIDQSECILCEGCVDICPWKCIHMVSVNAIADAVDTEQPGEDPTDNVAFIVDEDVCTRCALCVDRCETGVPAETSGFGGVELRSAFLASGSRGGTRRRHRPAAISVPTVQIAFL